MNDAIKVEKTETRTYIVPTSKVPDHAESPEDFAKTVATANEPDYKEGEVLEGFETEEVELCSACREPTERKVPLESGHDAPLCEECEEELDGGGQK